LVTRAICVDLLGGQMIESAAGISGLRVLGFLPTGVVWRRSSFVFLNQGFPNLLTQRL